MKISVAICTRNPREEYLHRVLDALRAQTLPLKDWELLLVSVAADGPLSGRFDLSWHPNGRYVLEKETGKTEAQLRAIAESSGELLLIVDDDNVLRPDYLQTCLKIATDYPWLGAWSGSCIPEFEVEPPAELRPWLGALIIEKLTEPVWAKLRQPSAATPIGTGMAVRRKVAAHYLELALHDPVRLLLGPKDKRPAAGEDADMAMCGLDLGLGTGRFPELELTHLIPARKLTLKWLEHSHEAFGYAGVLTSALHQPGYLPEPPRWGNARILVKNLLLRAAGKSRIERRIRLAEEKGKLRAQRELVRLQYRPPTPTG